MCTHWSFTDIDFDHTNLIELISCFKTLFTDTIQTYYVPTYSMSIRKQTPYTVEFYRSEFTVCNWFHEVSDLCHYRLQQRHRATYCLYWSFPIAGHSGLPKSKNFSPEAMRLQDFLMSLNGLISLSLILIPTIPSRSVQLVGLQTQQKIQ
jgi:hypothetical protein